jgi:hypothetical protein
MDPSGGDRVEPVCLVTNESSGKPRLSLDHHPPLRQAPDVHGGSVGTLKKPVKDTEPSGETPPRVARQLARAQQYNARSLAKAIRDRSRSSGNTAGRSTADFSGSVKRFETDRLRARPATSFKVPLSVAFPGWTTPSLVHERPLGEPPQGLSWRVGPFQPLRGCHGLPYAPGGAAGASCPPSPW